MTAVLAWAGSALTASTVLMLFLLVLRNPARRWVGPRRAYLLWGLPALRMILPDLPLPSAEGLAVPGQVVAGMSTLFIGPRLGSELAAGTGAGLDAGLILALWLGPALVFLVILTVRHIGFCRRLLADAVDLARAGGIRVVTADVAGPLAFGVIRRFVAVPRHFLRDYNARERELVLAHEYAHHARGDLLANWLSLLLLALHWWNPVAWIALRAFREDQELAADACVLAGRAACEVPLYARVLARTAGVGCAPACNLHTRSGLKQRLLTLGRPRPSRRRLISGGVALTLLGGMALLVSAATPDHQGRSRGGQVVTIGVKPDGRGGYGLVLDGKLVAPDGPLPAGMMLPADFSGAGGCDLGPAAEPFAMVIKGSGQVKSYTVTCGRALSAPLPVTLADGLTSLKAMRASVAAQPATPAFPDDERTHALGVIDHSIREMEVTLTRLDMPGGPPQD